MGLFDRMNKPIFLKEESDAAKFIVKLKELQEKASGGVKNRIEKEIKLASIGEIGENNIAFELKNSGMPMYVMHDIHYEIDGLSAQIDYIVVTRKIIFVIECKNLIGDIEIDHDGNFIRSYELNGKHIKEGIYSPITQNQRHLEILRQIKRDSKSNLLIKMLFDKYFDENYKFIVVLANPKTVLNARYAKSEVKNTVIRADQLNSYIKKIYEESKQAAFNDKDMKELAEGLLTFHKPNQSDYAKKYEEIINSMIDVSKRKSDAVQEEVKLDYNKRKDVEIKSISTEYELIKNLKAFRLQKSREENVKPYYIFSDKQMMDLISKMPNSKKDLLDVSGFGPIKSEKYGDDILKILHDNR